VPRGKRLAFPAEVVREGAPPGGSMCLFAVQRVLARPADLSASGAALTPRRRGLGGRQVTTIPAQPAEPARLPPALQHCGRRMASRPGHREIWFAATAGALLIIAGLHLLPRRLVRRPLRADLARAGASGRGRFVHRRGPAHPRRLRLPATPARMPAARARQPRWRFTASWRARPSRWPGRPRSRRPWRCTRSLKAWPPGRCPAPSHAASPAGWPPCASARSSLPPLPAPSPSRRSPGRYSPPWPPASSPRRPSTQPAEPCVRSRLTSAGGPLYDVVRGRRWPGRGD
jgi:hypothetical protein